MPNVKSVDHLGEERKRDSRQGTKESSTTRKMYPRLRDQDVHLFELGDYVYQWVDGWRVDVWLKEGHVEITRDRNDHDPRWAGYLYPYFQKKCTFGGKVPVIATKYASSGGLKWPFNNFRVYIHGKRYFLAGLPLVQASWSKGKTMDEITIYDIRKAKFDYKK